MDLDCLPDCVICKSQTKRRYNVLIHNFICQKCGEALIGGFGYEILELELNGDRELYVTKDMFIYLNKHKLIFQGFDATI